MWTKLAGLVLLAILAVPSALGQTTSFTYQGQLVSAGGPATGTYDFQFRLYDAPTGGTLLGSTLTFDGVSPDPAPLSVSNGLFTVPLDFGNQFPGPPRYLDISVRPHLVGSYTTLTPRQALSPAPYSIFSSAPWAVSGTSVSYTLGNVGIGTATPANRLVVSNPTDNNSLMAIDSGLTAAQFSSLRLNDRGTPLWVVTKNPSNDFSIRESGPALDRLYVAQGGNVGIGTSAPSNLLTVINAAGGDSTVAIDSGLSGGAAQNSVVHFNDRATPVWALNKLTNNDFAIREVGPAVDRLYLAQGGNVGIGSNSPQSKLEVRGDAAGLAVSDASGQEKVYAATGMGGGTGYLQIGNASNQLIDYIGANAAAPPNGLMGVTQPGTTTIHAGLRWTGSAGEMFADVKSFREPNPRRPGTDIAYACIEGPEAAAYVRGTAMLVDGVATVALPIHFQDVTVAEGMTVQLTPRSADSKGLAVVLEAADHFEVRELLGGKGSYAFDWRVEAVRRGYQGYEVIRPTAERMIPASAQHPSTTDAGPPRSDQ
jgi:hypothetical protein